MKEIGGYFELELPPTPMNRVPAGGLNVNSGRHALEYILISLGNKVKRILLPCYTCEAVLEPIKRRNLEFCFYSINQNLEIESLPELEEGDYIIANNYFGIKDSYIRTLTGIYKDKCIIDNSQALYYPARIGERGFYSPRKFFGVPDGGVAWTPDQIEIAIGQDVSFNRASHLIKRIDIGSQEGLSDFRMNSEKIKDEPLKLMSRLTNRILGSIDYDWAKAKRLTNFEFLHQSLASTNALEIPPIDTFACPMAYPYLTDDATLRQRLINNKIFVATYWPNVLDWCGKDTTEHNLTKNLIPLPIDQRYGEEDMERILKVINIS